MLIIEGCSREIGDVCKVKIQEFGMIAGGDRGILS